MAEWICPELYAAPDASEPFWDDPGPDPDDRFNWFFAALILAAVACGIIAWRVM